MPQEQGNSSATSGSYDLMGEMAAGLGDIDSDILGSGIVAGDGGTPQDGQAGHAGERPGATANPGHAPEQSQTPQPDEARDPNAQGTDQPQGEGELELTPFTYTVDGTDKPIEGMFKVAGGGAVIDEDALPAVMQRFAQAESAARYIGELQGQVQTFERAGGLGKMQELAIENARLQAFSQKVAALLDDPNALAEIATDERVARIIQRELATDLRDAQFKARSEWGERFTAHDRAEAQRVQQQTAISGTLDAGIAQVHNHFPKVLAEDVAEAKELFGPLAGSLVRVATPEDVRQYPQFKLGQPILDPGHIVKWFEKRSALREQQARAAQAAGQAGRENAARQGAANPRPTPAPNRQQQPAKPQQNQPPRPAPRDKGDDWYAQKMGMLAGVFPDE